MLCSLSKDACDDDDDDDDDDDEDNDNDIDIDTPATAGPLDVGARAQWPVRS